MAVSTLPRLTAAMLRDPADRDALLAAYPLLRAQTCALAAPLSPEDCAIQSMPEVSPTRWHLAHTTWFFETFVLRRFDAAWQPPDPAYDFLFNSYYNAIGPQFPRDRRGLLSRPGLADISTYRARVDAAVIALMANVDASTWADLGPVLLVGLHHEQQHQELILTDIKHVLAQNPGWPAYREYRAQEGLAPPLVPLACPGGLVEIGAAGDGFAFDNERPRHRVWLEDYQIANRCVTNGEYLQFIVAGGYEQPHWWMSLGWDTVRQQHWRTPLYWVHQDDGWWQFTLQGLTYLNLNEPVSHLSWFEADAYARFAGARLPTEAEWEHAQTQHPGRAGELQEGGWCHPRVAGAGEGLLQSPGDVWEWTASPYTPYPGYVPPPGAVGEYNGKFMCQQYVLRGGSCATPASHFRATYRNFFPPETRWQFSGLRLAWSAL